MEKDVCWKDFFSDNRRYADLINALVYDGEQIVGAEDIQIPAGANDSGERDLLRKVALGVHYALVGVENQESIDYRLPTRIMYYDAGEYWKQVKRIGKKLKKESARLQGGEFLYKFRKTDRLEPVITFVLYAGKEDWDGPTKLSDIIDFGEMPEKFRELAGDYKVNLINIRNFERTELFQTDVKLVFDFIRWSEDKVRMKELLEERPEYRNLEMDTAEVIQKYGAIGATINMEDYKTEGGKVDMCKAWADMAEEQRAIGVEKGILEGERNGILKMILNFLTNGGTKADAMRMLGVSEEEVEMAEKMNR